MDIFRLHNPTAPTLMEQGEIINDISSKMWVERYSQAGEFALIADVETGLREKLPIGSFISHTNTPELMIVEDHEINDSDGENSTIKVTGRGYETILEQRITGGNRTLPRNLTDSNSKFDVAEAVSWEQIVYILTRHIDPTFQTNPENAIPYITALTNASGAGRVTERHINMEPVYTTLLRLLAVDNVGIRVIRPGVWSILGDGNPNTAFLIHQGVNRSNQVSFSYDTGEIVSADYLWSNKSLKTSALVTGKYLQVMFHIDAFHGYTRRIMMVDGTDVDEDVIPSFVTVDNPIRDYFISVMENKGREALLRQKNVVLTKAEVSKNAVNTRYRSNYDVGDLVSVVGDYNQSSVMRVTEFVEIEDENGSQAYPTLALETE